MYKSSYPPYELRTNLLSFDFEPFNWRSVFSMNLDRHLNDAIFESKNITYFRLYDPLDWPVNSKSHAEFCHLVLSPFSRVIYALSLFSDFQK